MFLYFLNILYRKKIEITMCFVKTMQMHRILLRNTEYQ